jgi:hypothetical protein
MFLLKCSCFAIAYVWTALLRLRASHAKMSGRHGLNKTAWGYFCYGTSKNMVRINIECI